MKRIKKDEAELSITEYYEAQKRKMKAMIMQLVCVLVVAGFALAAYFARAWFANNRRVDANNSTIQTESQSPSLFIEAGLEKGTGFNSFAKGQTSAYLYPISTTNCKDWYYVSGWELVQVADKYTTVPLANEFTRISGETEADSVIRYTDINGETHTACYKQAFNLYTDVNRLDVYLDPENPIEITYPEDATDGVMAEIDRVKSAVRVAITDEAGNLILYYVPSDEVGKGNSMDSQADAYHAVQAITATPTLGELVKLTSQETQAAQALVLPMYRSGTITDVTAERIDSTTYAATEYSKRICTTDADTGTVLYTYVWLEGTDAQTQTETTAGISSPLSVKLSFVGVEP